MAEYNQVRAAFADFYKAERDRAEKTLVDILDILCKHASEEEIVVIDAITQRLEAHWTREEPR